MITLRKIVEGFADMEAYVMACESLNISKEEQERMLGEPLEKYCYIKRLDNWIALLPGDLTVYKAGGVICLISPIYAGGALRQFVHSRLLPD